jgi:hypothetical protein
MTTFDFPAGIFAGSHFAEGIAVFFIHKALVKPVAPDGMSGCYLG